jgi:hypothetical protein
MVTNNSVFFIEDVLRSIWAKMGPDRSEYIFNEENAVIRDHIERLMAGERSRINPNLVLSN